MPLQRLQLHHTIEFKVQQVELFHESTLSRVKFCEGKTYSRSTHQLWEKELPRLHRAIAEEKRAKKLTVGGSGRKSPSDEHEEAIIVWIKERRRDNKTVTVLGIIAECKKLLPDFIEAKSIEARRAWCFKFMRRRKLTIRKISHSGRKKRSTLMAQKEAFALKTGLEYTVEFVGATHVSADGAGKGGHRCTVALLACADGTMCIPHFVFQGEDGCDVFEEVGRFVDPSHATYSVQTNAWFDERVMLEWIDKVWQYVVTGPTVLLLDSLKVHKCEAVQQRLADMGTMTYYVPAGCTSVAQPLDVGVMAPFKKQLRDRFEELYGNAPSPNTASERRYDMYQRVLHVLPNITTETIRNAFFKSGPFIPFGPSAPFHTMISDFEVLV